MHTRTTVEHTNAKRKAGEPVLSVMVQDDSMIHEAVTILDAHHPIQIDERTEETATESQQVGSPDVAGGMRDSLQPARRSGEEVIPLAEEQLEIGKRVVDRGTTRVRRYVVRTPIEKDVTLHGQRVTIERRRPVETTGVPRGAFEERTVEVHETEEVPVVQKTARLAEEVVIRREDTERTETVHDTVRREEIRVNETGKPATAAR